MFFGRLVSILKKKKFQKTGTTGVLRPLACRTCKTVKVYSGQLYDEASALLCKCRNDHSGLQWSKSLQHQTYLGSPCLLMTPLFRRQRRRLLTKTSGWVSASWPITESSSLRDEASLVKTHVHVKLLKPSNVFVFTLGFAHKPTSICVERDRTAYTDLWQQPLVTL